MLLSLRYRIRHDLGMPEDDYDRLLGADRRPGKASTSSRRPTGGARDNYS